MQLPPQSAHTPEWLISALEEAGTILQRLNVGRIGPARVRISWPGEPTNARPSSSVTAGDIAFMDQVFGLVWLLPATPILPRVLVRRRSMREMENGRYVWSWRKLANEHGCSHEAARKWHGQAISRILRTMAQESRKAA